MTRWVLVLLIVFFAPRGAWAHKPSDALLRLVVEPAAITARWEVALRDLEVRPGGIDDGDGALHLQELMAKEAVLFEQLRAHVRLAAGGEPCLLLPGVPAMTVTEHSDGAYAALTATVHCPSAGALSLDYDYLFEADPQHRLIVQVGAETHILSRDRRTLRVDTSAPARTSNLFGSGLTHILEGTDHLLFLFALLLPAVLVQRQNRRMPADTFRPVLGEVLRVVTAFTVAHSLTLSLAVIGLATLPARLVEPAIAASVIVAAVANLLPPRERSWFGGARWPIAYTLGLLHGYGFSSALDDAGLQGSNVAVPLLTFNLGVETGQLAVVAVVLPVLFLIRRWRRYERVVLVGCSVVVAAVASAWFVERTFDVTLLG